MEKVESIFSPEDRMGALELQNLSVLDNRAFLIHHLDALRQLAPGAEPPLGEMLALEDPDKTKS
jgi:argininosuccinate synthase